MIYHKSSSTHQRDLEILKEVIKGKRYMDVCELHGVTQERIGQIVRKGLKKLSNRLGEPLDVPTARELKFRCIKAIEDVC